jgi:hypothetical protein
MLWTSAFNAQGSRLIIRPFIYNFIFTHFVFYIYIYTNLNEYYILTLAWSVNKFHYRIYTYTQSVSPKPFTCTTLAFNFTSNIIWFFSTLLLIVPWALGSEHMCGGGKVHGSSIAMQNYMISSIPTVTCVISSILMCIYV